MPEPHAEDPRASHSVEIATLIGPLLLPGETVETFFAGAAAPHAVAEAVWGGRWAGVAGIAGVAGRGTRPVLVALTRRRLFLIRPGSGVPGWADPVGRVVVEAFRQGRDGTSRLRLRRLAVPDRLVRIRAGAQWRTEVALIAAELPRATPFTLPD